MTEDMAEEKDKKQKFRLICFDLDGTIIDETVFIWQTIHDHVKTDKEKRQKAAEDFFSKRISYEQWMTGDLEMWKEVGATKKEIMEALEPLKLMPGAMEALKELKRRGLKLAIISGSLNIAIEKVMPDYNDYFDDVFINHIYFDEHGNISGGKATAHDFEHKASALKEICKRESISPDECVFVGDHENDIQAAEAAGLSIAFNCKSDSLAQVADVVIEKKDLREILDHI
ncbi:HAD-IB family phosphatase [Candidatus Woesearchaeota archaeon]|nr:HAD-IB family phosphatase [Candidatus Woesearchaeota archaeon]